MDYKFLDRGFEQWEGGKSPIPIFESEGKTLWAPERATAHCFSRGQAEQNFKPGVLIVILYYLGGGATSIRGADRPADRPAV